MPAVQIWVRQAWYAARPYAYPCPLPALPPFGPHAAPCLEFAGADSAYTSNENCVRMQNTTCLYYDNRYW